MTAHTIDFSRTADAVLSDDVKWDAIRESDSSFDGRFVYVVKTYGVYCRPSCPSRLPKRENTIFFETPEHAKAAGYRACKRCNGIPAPKTPKDEDIGYAIARTSLGFCLVAIGPRAIMTVELGDDAEALKSAFVEQYRNAFPLDDEHPAMGLVQSVVNIVENPSAAHSIPLDMQGTDFQKRVWNALMKIPAGKTVTYSKLAKAIGNPAATRAVGTACGANRFAVLVPCHRVVRADGSSKGFRWGLPRKQKLLQLEAQS